MVGFTSSLAVLATLASTTVSGAVIQRSPQTSNPFGPNDARVLSTGNEKHPRFNELYLQEFHTGAGENAIVGVKSSANAPKFYVQDTKLKTQLGSDIYEVYLAPGLYGGDTAPAVLKSIQLNIGQGSKGFTITPDDLLVSNESSDFEGFTVCDVKEVSDTDAEGPDFQLLWRSKGVTTPKGMNCQDVAIVASG